MTNSGYPYIGGDPIELRHSYAYTPYSGQRFLSTWRAARDAVSATLGPPTLTLMRPERKDPPPSGKEVDTASLLDYLAETRRSDNPGSDSDRWLRWMIQRFEVTKRVYTYYKFNDGRIEPNGEYKRLSAYLHLAEALALSTERRTFFPGLNALIKCLDTLCSYAEALTIDEKSRLARLISIEGSIVANLRQIGNGAWADGHGVVPDPATPIEEGAKTKFLQQTGLVLADTLRSRAYVQALRTHGFRVPYALIVEAISGAQRWGQATDPPAPTTELPGNYPFPDLRIQLAEVCHEIADKVEKVATGTVNHDDVTRRLQSATLQHLVYSGFGGEIVSDRFLDRTPPVIHLHAGWLPDSRGSTTIYYSMLREGLCGCSAIIISPEIDKGEIVARKYYPTPPPEMNIDYVYDGVIRSDLLVAVMQILFRDGRLSRILDVAPDNGETYYIIHPVLKHVSILNNLDANKSYQD